MLRSSPICVWGDDAPVRARLSILTQSIVTANDDKTARVWKSADGRLVAILQHRSVVKHAGLSSDDARTLTASFDHTERSDRPKGKLLGPWPPSRWFRH